MSKFGVVVVRLRNKDKVLPSCATIARKIRT
jgi:hypothetical protein